MRNRKKRPRLSEYSLLQNPDRKAMETTTTEPSIFSHRPSRTTPSQTVEISKENSQDQKNHFQDSFEDLFPSYNCFLPIMIVRVQQFFLLTTHSNLIDISVPINARIEKGAISFHTLEKLVIEELIEQFRSSFGLFRVQSHLKTIPIFVGRFHQRGQRNTVWRDTFSRRL
jgi:hypothetical protein